MSALGGAIWLPPAALGSNRWSIGSGSMDSAGSAGRHSKPSIRATSRICSRSLPSMIWRRPRRWPRSSPTTRPMAATTRRSRRATRVSPSTARRSPSSPRSSHARSPGSRSRSISSSSRPASSPTPTTPKRISRREPKRSSSRRRQRTRTSRSFSASTREPTTQTSTTSSRMRPARRTVWPRSRRCFSTTSAFAAA